MAKLGQNEAKPGKRRAKVAPIQPPCAHVGTKMNEIFKLFRFCPAFTTHTHRHLGSISETLGAGLLWIFSEIYEDLWAGIDANNVDRQAIRPSDPRMARPRELRPKRGGGGGPEASAKRQGGLLCNRSCALHPSRSRATCLWPHRGAHGLGPEESTPSRRAVLIAPTLVTLCQKRDGWDAQARLPNTPTCLLTPASRPPPPVAFL